MFLLVLLAIFAILAGAAFYVLWLPALRVNAIEVQGTEQEGVQEVAMQAIAGLHWYGVPRNSIFVLPESDMRARVMHAYPDISAVSIKPKALDAITIRVTSRAPAFMWCGTSIDVPPVDGACFDADAEGLVFALADPAETEASSSLRIFAPLDRDTGESPISAHVVATKQIPDALRFVKAMRSLGAPVSALSIQGDEADLYLQGPTKIRYVLGHEAEAAQLAASAFPTLNLTDGSIDYIDLRFIGSMNTPGKAYVKRFGE